MQSGKILIAGQDIAGVTLFSLHQNISLIAQEPALFNRSISENIRFARPKATDEEVRAAARLAAEPEYRFCRTLTPQQARSTGLFRLRPL